MSFRGNLAGMDLDEVIGFLASNCLEGTLEVRSGDAASIRLYFRPEGRVFFPFSARRGTYSLGKLLRHTGVLSRESLERYLGEVKRQRKADMLNEEAGEAQVGDARRRQFTEELHDLFLWRDASYDFNPGPLPPRVAQDLEAERGLLFEPNSLLFEVARRKDERGRIQQVIPSSRLVLQAKPGSEAAVVEALRAGGLDLESDPFSGDLRLDDLLDRWGVPHHEALTAVTALVEAGILLVLSAAQARDRVDDALEVGDVAAATRLLGHLLELERRRPEGPLVLGSERGLIESEAFGHGPDTSCAMRLGGARGFVVALELLTARREFTLVLHNGSETLRVSALPGEVSVAASSSATKDLLHYLELEGGLKPEEAKRLRAARQDPAGHVAPETLARATLRRAVDEIACGALWTDADATLRNRHSTMRSDFQPLVVSLDDDLHARLVEQLGAWRRRFELVPSEGVMFLPGRPVSAKGMGRFLARFSLRRSLGELRREARAAPLEFVTFASKALEKGFLRAPALGELEAAVEEAQRDQNDVLVYKLGRAGEALGHGEAFAPLLAKFQGREPVLYGAPSLQGDLDGIGLAAVLQALHDQRRTGTLAVSAGEGEERLHFSRGDAFVLRGEDQEAADFADFFLGEEGSDQVSALGEVGGSYVSDGSLSPTEMRELKDDFLDLLFWEQASFTFYPDDLPDSFFHPEEERVSKIALDTRSFLLEAMHHMSEWDRIKVVVPTPDAVFEFAEGRKGAEVARRTSAAPILMLIDGRLSVRDLVRVSGEQLLEVGRLVSILVRDGALLPVEAG